MNEPPPLPEDMSDENTVEVMRIWLVGEELQVALQPQAFDAATWGALLANMARYIAQANQEVEGIPSAQTLAEITATFQDEINKTPEDPS